MTWATCWPPRRRLTRCCCETKALKLGRYLAVNRSHIHSIMEVNKLAEGLEKEIVT